MGGLGLTRLDPRTVGGAGAEVDVSGGECVALRGDDRLRLEAGGDRGPAGDGQDLRANLVRLRSRVALVHGTLRSFGSPADPEGPVALRPLLAEGLPFR